LAAVKKIIGVKGNQAAIGMDDMHAGLLDRADFESMGMRMEFLKEYKPERPWAWKKNTC